MEPLMSFGRALELLKSDSSVGVTRKGWLGSDAKPTVYLQNPDGNSKMTEPYLYMEKCLHTVVVRFPLDLSCESILAEDWVRVN